MTLKTKPGTKPTPPCRPDGKPCPLRGTEVCHTKDCPHGWAEYEKASEEYRQWMTAQTKQKHILWK